MALVQLPTFSLLALVAIAVAEDHNSASWQIKAYGSAAPDFLAASATISDGKNVLKKGTNGWTCMPANPRGMSDPDNGWLSAHEAMPVCFDAAGLDWMEGWMSQSKPVMKRDSYVWMLAGDMGEDNSTPMTMTQAEANGTWIESGPHLMLFPKDPESLDSWPDDPFKGEPYVMFKGTDYAHVMIPLPGYYAYSPADKAPKGFGGSAVAAEPPPAEVPFTPPSLLALGFALGVAASLAATRLTVSRLPMV
ncbi:hypothetical protein EMIHUDRAFT_463656 [Emiliania huxleyi CCMP1516]|uniref:Uncharacterized protein n=2 Tax=Emiliania huxleyi TaxID=2903 RepID=A0A0D3JF54_EMIH1|nr:hypothetical protein EMIHUDRAFT_463656 [Emiliania huxleyi CCMP1516]EOD22139.1 hypothetical protein EMIHUDRAFT_463656 [Emiliania huxleyi CCMP1516]|eukprot:XP_005774568.1 hypothetical protein EMIHUDRAFT_463656 [Emiliania huxleyi CCMP1516]